MSYKDTIRRLSREPGVEPADIIKYFTGKIIRFSGERDLPSFGLVRFKNLVFKIQEVERVLKRPINSLSLIKTQKKQPVWIFRIRVDGGSAKIFNDLPIIDDIKEYIKSEREFGVELVQQIAFRILLFERLVPYFNFGALTRIAITVTNRK